MGPSVQSWGGDNQALTVLWLPVPWYDGGRLHLKALLMPHGTNEKSPGTRRRAQVHCGSWRLTGASVPCAFKDYVQSKACFSALCWIDFFWELENFMFMHSLAGFLAPYGIENRRPLTSSCWNAIAFLPPSHCLSPAPGLFASLLTEFSSGWWGFTGQQQAAK